MPISVYFIFQCFLFVLSGYLFYRTTSDLMKKREYVIFKVFIIAFLVYLVFNSLWTMQEFEVIKMPNILFRLVCFASLSSVVFNSYCFYKFSMIYYGYYNKQNKLYEILGGAPFLVVLAFNIISIFNGMVFSVSDAGKIIIGPLYYFQMVVAFLYFLIIFVSSITTLIKAKSPQARKNSLTIFLVVLFLVVWVLIDDLFQGLTIIPVAIFSVILTIFTTFQQAGINTDALTQMNNRRKALEYMTNQLSSVSINKPLYFIACDINHFKSINDSYGHNEGDIALIIVANAIKETIGELNGFAARYGGDEFIIAIKENELKTNVEQLMLDIEDKIRIQCIVTDKPYEIKISYGYVKCIDSKTSFENYMKEADSLLYSNKEKIYGKEQ